MKYNRFEDLPVWKSAMDLGVKVYALTRKRAFRGPGDLRSQLRRAALSVSNNIAEGFERGTTSELLTFIYIARGSAGEIRSMLHFVERLLGERMLQGANIAMRNAENTRRSAESAKADPTSGSRELEISNFKSEISNLKTLAESCSRQLRGWADSLQNSDIKGQRHLTEHSKQVFEQQKRADAFWERVEAATKANLSRSGFGSEG